LNGILPNNSTTIRPRPSQLIVSSTDSPTCACPSVCRTARRPLLYSKGEWVNPPGLPRRCPPLFSEVAARCLVGTPTEHRQPSPPPPRSGALIVSPYYGGSLPPVVSSPRAPRRVVRPVLRDRYSAPFAFESSSTVHPSPPPNHSSPNPPSTRVLNLLPQPAATFAHPCTTFTHAAAPQSPASAKQASQRLAPPRAAPARAKGRGRHLSTRLPH